MDGADSIEEVQLSQYNMDDWLILKDVNFDGYCDIGLQAATPAYNLPYYFWLYNPEALALHQLAADLPEGEGAPVRNLIADMGQEKGDGVWRTCSSWAAWMKRAAT